MVTLELLDALAQARRNERRRRGLVRGQASANRVVVDLVEGALVSLAAELVALKRKGH